MIELIKNNDELILHYAIKSQYEGHVDWVKDNINNNGSATIKHTFTVAEKHWISETNVIARNIAKEVGIGDYYFSIGEIVNGYYRIPEIVLGTKHCVNLFQHMIINAGTFVNQDDRSIFKRLDKLAQGDIYIGGEIETAIPVADYELLLKTFPTRHELGLYATERISRILQNYLGTIPDPEEKFNQHIRRKEARLKLQPSTHEYTKYEILKYEYIRDQIIHMRDHPKGYSEKDWQNKILEFVLLIMPKYIAALKEVYILDSYSEPGKKKKRKCDIMLVDANGYVDVIEIKKPFERCLISSGKYRDNHIPKRELSGTAMQVEKYIFHLNKWGQAGEMYLTEKYKDKFPSDFTIRITNPKGLLIIGKNDFESASQQSDFEVAKRHYSNLIDIITYDDLIKRLENCIQMLRVRK